MNWKLFRNAPCFEHPKCIPEKATCLDFFNHWNEHNNQEKGWERHLLLPAKRERELENKPCGKHCLTSQQPRRSPSLLEVSIVPWSLVKLCSATFAQQDKYIPQTGQTLLFPNGAITHITDLLTLIKGRQILAQMRHRHCDGPSLTHSTLGNA